MIAGGVGVVLLPVLPAVLALLVLVGLWLRVGR
jgi:hypothetical protein